LKKQTENFTQYKNAESKNKFYELYEEALELWPIEYISKMIDTSYGKTHVIISGNKNEETVVLIPGGNANATMWFENVKELAGSYKVIAIDTIDAPGKSEPNIEIIQEEQYIEWLNEVFQKMELKKISMIGISLGGWMALKYAVSYPERIKKIVLLDPITAFAPLKTSFLLHIIIPFMILPNRITLKKFNKWLNDGFIPNKRWVEEFISGILYCKPQKVRPKTISIDEYRKIVFPVLLLMGGKNKVCNLKVVKQNIQKYGPTVDLEILKNSAHSLQFEEAEYVNNRINNFLSLN
jgi:pimeloyl-ACP methyl ester carboxylesterase